MIVNGHLLKQRLAALSVFVCAALLAVAAGYYKQKVDSERINYRISLPSQQVQVVKVDVGRQGWPKYLAQPGCIRLSSGMRGIKNTSQRSLTIQIETTGLDYVQLTSATHDVTGRSVQLGPGQGMSLSLLLDIPRMQAYQRAVGLLQVRFIEVGSGLVLGQVDFVVGNSRAGQTVAAEMQVGSYGG